MESYILVIPGRLDGLNNYIDANRANAYKGSKIKKRNQEICKWEILKQLRGVKIDKPVTIDFAWYEPNRRRDHDNVSSFGRKVIQDALVDAGVLRDDGWNYITGFSDHFYVDRENPRIEVRIEVMEADAGRLHKT